MKFDVLSVPDSFFSSPSFSDSSRDKEPIYTDRIILMSFIVFSVTSLPTHPPFIRLSLFSSSFSIRTREGCLHAYKAVGVRALEEKHGGGRTSLERVLKTAVREEEKEKAAKEREGCERAKTRPDGNDPKEFRGPPFLSSFLFPLLRDSRLCLLLLSILFHMFFSLPLTCTPPWIFLYRELVFLFIPDLGQSRTR